MDATPNKQDFVWYELMTSDLDAAASFYRDLVGWNLAEVGGPGMRYLAAAMAPNTRGVGGIMELTEPMRAAGARPGWIGYIFCPDVATAVAGIRAAGGSIHREPAEIPGVGTFAVAADPQGAIFNLFKPNPQPNAPPALAQDAAGNVGWRELMALDWEKAWEFYSSQFGWTLSEGYDMGEAGRYQTFSTNDAPMTGGMMSIPQFLREHMNSARWTYYFNVANIHDAKARVESGGGQVTHGPTQVPGGGWILNGTDPQGVSFALLSFNG